MTAQVGDAGAVGARENLGCHVAVRSAEKKLPTWAPEAPRISKQQQYSYWRGKGLKVSRTLGFHSPGGEGEGLGPRTVTCTESVKRRTPTASQKNECGCESIEFNEQLIPQSTYNKYLISKQERPWYEENHTWRVRGT